MSDRIAVMEAGEVQQCGTEEVYERPTGRSWPASSGSRTSCRARTTSISVRPEKIWLGELQDGMTVHEGTVVDACTSAPRPR